MRTKVLISIVASMLAIALMGAIYITITRRVKLYGVVLKPEKVHGIAEVPFYLQNDPEWASLKLGGSDSVMASAGCLVTSISSALDAYGIKMSPFELVSIFNQHDVLNENGMIVWKDIKKAIPSIDYKYSRVFNSKTIEQLLDKQLLPIVEVRYKGSGVKHWVVVIGADEEDFLIMDPLNAGKMPEKLSIHGSRAYAYRVLVKK